MVAEAQPPQKPSAGGPATGPASVAKSAQPRTHQRIPLIARMQVRNLYLSQALTYKEIATRTGLTLRQVEQLICVDKLAGQKRKKTAELTKRTDARVDAVFEEFQGVAAREAEEITLGALKNAKETLTAGHEDAPKHFQAWTAGIGNLVKVSRTMRGLDQQQSGASGISGNVTLNMFVVESIRDMRPLANAERSANANTPQLPQSNAIEVQAKPVE